MVCPWNKFASPSGELDFAVRIGLDDVTLIELFGWSEAEFHERLAGSAIHRIGYERTLGTGPIKYRRPPKEFANEKKYRVAVVGRMAHLDRDYSAAQFQLQRIGHRDGRPRYSSRHLDRRRPIAFQGDDRGRTYAMR